MFLTEKISQLNKYLFGKQTVFNVYLNPINSGVDDCIQLGETKIFKCTCATNYQIMINNDLKTLVNSISKKPTVEEKKKDFFASLILLKYYPHSFPFYISWLFIKYRLPSVIFQYENTEFENSDSENSTCEKPDSKNFVSENSDSENSVSDNSDAEDKTPLVFPCSSSIGTGSADYSGEDLEIGLSEEDDDFIEGGVVYIGSFRKNDEELFRMIFNLVHVPCEACNYGNRFIDENNLNYWCNIYSIITNYVMQLIMKDNRKMFYFF